MPGDSIPVEQMALTFAGVFPIGPSVPPLPPGRGRCHSCQHCDVFSSNPTVPSSCALCMHDVSAHAPLGPCRQCPVGRCPNWLKQPMGTSNDAGANACDLCGHDAKNHEVSAHAHRPAHGQPRPLPGFAQSTYWPGKMSNVRSVTGIQSAVTSWCFKIEVKQGLKNSTFTPATKAHAPAECAFCTLCTINYCHDLRHNH